VQSGPDLTMTRTVCLDDTGLSVAESIAQQVGALHIGLVVMGTQSRHGLSGLLQGSVARAVLHAVSVPVLLIRAPGAPAKNQLPAMNRVPAKNQVPAKNGAPHADVPAPPEAATSCTFTPRLRTSRFTQETP
jgi:Universal stress protein family